MLLTSPEAHAMYKDAQAVIRDLQADNARLQAELDSHRGHQVLHATEAQIRAMLSVPDDPALADCAEGSVLRATDTGAAWTRTAAGWVPDGWSYVGETADGYILTAPEGMELPS